MKFEKSIHPFLQHHIVSVLSVINEDGVPHSASLHYAWDEARGVFVFFTRKTTLKYKAISEKAQKAALVIGFSEEEFATVQMHGEAKVLEDESSKEVYLKKFERLRAFVSDENAVFLQFAPTWYRYSDLKQTPPIIISSDE